MADVVLLRLQPFFCSEFPLQLLSCQLYSLTALVRTLHVHAIFFKPLRQEVGDQLKSALKVLDLWLCLDDNLGILRLCEVLFHVFDIMFELKSQIGKILTHFSRLDTPLNRSVDMFILFCLCHFETLFLQFGKLSSLNPDVLSIKALEYS